jgi:hypothetical protein
VQQPGFSFIITAVNAGFGSRNIFSGENKSNFIKLLLTRTGDRKY